MSLKRAVAVGLMTGIAWTTSARAYQSVKVGPNGGTVYTSPKSDSATAGTLRAGVAINIGDQPTHGYYRCSAAGGITGWISADDVKGARPSASRSTAHAASPRTSRL